MTGSEFRCTANAAGAMHGSITAHQAGLFGEHTITIVSSFGDVLETGAYEEAIDCLCGGADHNRPIDMISGRRATVVAAEDTTTGAVICRVCHVDRHDRMAPRFNLLDARSLRRTIHATGQAACACGRTLA